MSRAVLICPRLGRPDALRNVVRVMFSRRAMVVIIMAKSRSLLARFSATTVATSLADFVTRAKIASSTVMVSPRFRPSRDAGWRAARAETLSWVFSVHLPTSNASNTM
jgi:hypothetical protein